MKKTLLLAVLAILTFSNFGHGAAIIREDNYNYYLYLILGPRKSDPLWKDWANIKINKLYTTRTLSDEDIGYRLQTPHITANTKVANDMVLWLVMRITGKNGSKINQNMLSFGQSSSDSGNALANEHSLVGGSWAYSLHAMGVIWGSGGERTADQKLTSGNDIGNADELLFFATQSAYFPYSSEGESSYLSTWIQNQDLRLINWGRVVNPSSGKILAKASRTLQLSGTPLAPRLSIVKSEDNGVLIRFNDLEPQRTGTLEWQYGINQWIPEATINSGDVILRPVSPGTMRLFRVRLQ